jgi:hypothetical protein
VSTAEFLSRWDDPLTVQHNPRFNPPTPASIARFWPLFLDANDDANLTGRAPAPGARIRINHAYGLYAPLTYTVWGALAAIAQTRDAGLNPWIFHCANGALHALASLVVFAILRRLISSDWPALAGAMIFAIHPIQVEPVAWVSGMKDVICGLLSLIATWQYIEARGATFRSARYWLAVLAFIGALLSKPSAVTVPLILIVIDHVLLHRTLKDSLRMLLPWFVIAAALGWIATVAQPAIGVAPAPSWARPLIVGDSIAFYLRQIIFPLWLGLDYGRYPAAVIGAPLCYVAWLVPAAMLIASWTFRRAAPLLSTGMLIFIIAPLPTLGLTTFLFQTYSTVADHYVYVAILGPAMIVAWFCWKFRSSAIARVGLLVVLALLGLRTFIQCGVWRDDRALFGHALEVNPSSFLAHNNLGDIYAAENQLDQAEVEFLAANRANPAYLPALRNLAHLADIRGRADEAARWRERIGQVELRLPPELRNNLSKN